jgi:HAE1 family hydrophobic/amphiphilic exporter-1
VAGGLLLSQLLTLYITPVIYVYLDQIGDNFSIKKIWRYVTADASRTPAE